jgi:hypothetical protein
MNDERGSADPGLDRVIRALTADGDTKELANRDDALLMFRTRRRPPRARRHWRFSARASVVAAVIGFCAMFGVAAYAAALPSPIQRIAQSVLARFGMERSYRAAVGSSSSWRPQAPVPEAISAAARPTCPCRVSPRTTAGSSLTLSLRSARVEASGYDVLTGHDRAGAGIRVRLVERVAGQTVWRVAATGVTNANGVVTLTVRDLTHDTAFRLLAADNLSSATVTVTVIPGVLLQSTGTDLMSASVPFGDPGDLVTLEVLIGGSWRDVGTHVLGSSRQASFAVSADSATVREYRVVLAATAAHGSAISATIRLAG